jgi:hypothetical protein
MSTDNQTFAFQTYCHSKQESNSPFIPQIIELSYKLHSMSSLEISSLTIAHSYGKRLLITAMNADMKQLHRKDFVEIIDVDPVKHTIFYFGPTHPPIITPFLWMLHYAKREIQCSIYFTSTSKENIIESFPHIKSEGAFLTILKNMLKTLQHSPGIRYNDNVVLITAKSFDEMEQIIKKEE